MGPSQLQVTSRSLRIHSLNHHALTHNRYCCPLSPRPSHPRGYTSSTNNHPISATTNPSNLSHNYFDRRPKLHRHYLLHPPRLSPDLNHNPILWLRLYPNSDKLRNSLSSRLRNLVLHRASTMSNIPFLKPLIQRITNSSTTITTLTSCPAKVTCHGQTSTWTGTEGPFPCPTAGPTSSCSCVLPGSSGVVTVTGVTSVTLSESVSETVTPVEGGGGSPTSSPVLATGAAARGTGGSGVGGWVVGALGLLMGIL